MATFSFQWTHQEDIDRWQKIIDKGGKLGPKQQARWDAWHKAQAKGKNPNALGDALLDVARQQAMSQE